MSERLKPCPFCGGEAELIKPRLETPWTVECKKCGCILFTEYECQRKAIAAWNRRQANDT